MFSARKWQHSSQCVSRWYDEVLGNLTFYFDKHQLLNEFNEMFDLQDFRDPKNGARYRFEGKSESVRDVQFNPVSIYEFAAAFETGTIQASWY